MRKSLVTSIVLLIGCLTLSGCVAVPSQIGTTQEEICHTTTTLVINGVRMWQAADPEQWKEYEKQLKKNLGPCGYGIARAIQGLPVYPVPTPDPSDPNLWPREN